VASACRRFLWFGAISAVALCCVTVIEAQGKTTRACRTPDEPKRFEVRFQYIVQDDRVVRRPRANRRFYVGYSVKIGNADIRLTIRRAGRTVWAHPEKGTVQDGGALEYPVPGLRRGRYRMTMHADSDAKDQKICLSRALIVRR
jgi:hypothetical protein